MTFHAGWVSDGVLVSTSLEAGVDEKKRDESDFRDAPGATPKQAPTGFAGERKFDP